MLASLAAVVGPFGWGLALAFSLAIAAFVSYVLLRRAPEQTFRLTGGVGRTRGFKWGDLAYPFSVDASAAERGVGLELISSPEGVWARLDDVGGGSYSLTVSSKYAGVFGGFKVRIGMRDPIGLFARYEVRELELSAEFLPHSLLTRRGAINITAAMLGDFPAGGRGFAQEFYTAEMYDSSHDSKDILWKRQANLAVDGLMVRVGEANVPESLTLCFLESQRRDPRELPAWMDMASEAVSRIGLAVVGSGTALRVVHIVGEEATVAEARGVKELADLVAWLWLEDVPKVVSRERADQAAILMTGDAEMKRPEVFALLSKKPSVVLTYGTWNAVPGSGVVFFTGHEDVSGLVRRVLSK